MFDINNPPTLTYPDADPKVAALVKQARDYRAHIFGMTQERVVRIQALRQGDTSIQGLLDAVRATEPSVAPSTRSLGQLKRPVANLVREAQSA